MNKLKNLPWWDIIVIALLAWTIYGVITTEGHDKIMNAVTFWGLLICWKLDGIYDRFKRKDEIHIYISGDGTIADLEAAINKADRRNRANL